MTILEIVLVCNHQVLKNFHFLAAKIYSSSVQIAVDTRVQSKNLHGTLLTYV